MKLKKTVGNRKGKLNNNLNIQHLNENTLFCIHFMKYKFYVKNKIIYLVKILA